MPPPVNETKILDAALNIWRELGYRDATTLKVAERAGISEVTLFRRFGDKGRLFATALSREAQTFEIDAIKFTGELESDLLGIVMAYDRMLSRNGAIVADFLLNRPSHPAFNELASIPQAAMAKVAQMIVAFQVSGQLQAGHPMHLLLDLLSPLLVGHLLQRAQPELGLEVSPQETVTRFLDGAAANNLKSG